MLLHRILIGIFMVVVATSVNAQKAEQHIVLRGETFASIAKKYGITEQQLKNANSRHPTCYAGLKLTIPAVSSVDNSKVQPEQPLKVSNSKEYSFEVSTIAVDNTINSIWKIEYNSGSKRFSLLKDDYMLYLLLPVKIGTTAYYDDVPIVDIYRSHLGSIEKNRLPMNWGGHENELLFMGTDGILIFGLYIDSKEIGKDKQHNGYIIYHQDGEFKPQETNLISHVNFTKYKELLEIAKSLSAEFTISQ